MLAAAVQPLYTDLAPDLGHKGIDHQPGDQYYTAIVYNPSDSQLNDMVNHHYNVQHTPRNKNHVHQIKLQKILKILISNYFSLRMTYCTENINHKANKKIQYCIVLVVQPFFAVGQFVILRKESNRSSFKTFIKSETLLFGIELIVPIVLTPIIPSTTNPAFI